MDILRFLATVDILADLNTEEIQHLAEASQYIEFPEGADVIKRGDIGRFLWVVYDGEVEVILPAADGGEDVVASLERGSVLGEMSIMTGEPANATVRVSRKAGMVKILREAFSRVIATNPKTLTRMTRIITRRLMEDEKHAEERERKLAAYRENADPYDLNFSSVAEPMRILVLNCGSSSLKYALYDTASRSAAVTGLVERIGSGAAMHSMRTADAKSEVPVPEVKTAEDAMKTMMSAVTGSGGMGKIDAVGHRVVHGGARFSSSERITDEVTGAIQTASRSRPFTNPRNSGDRDHAGATFRGSAGRGFRHRISPHHAGHRVNLRHSLRAFRKGGHQAVRVPRDEPPLCLSQRRDLPETAGRRAEDDLLPPRQRRLCLRHRSRS